MHRPGTVLAAVLSTFVLTATASADSYCVAPAGGCDHSASSLADALTQAATHAGEDAISLGAATYTEDGLTYNPADNAKVTIAGVSQDATTISPLTSANSSITLHGAGGPVDLADLTVVTGTHTSNTAIELNQGGSLSRVQVLSGTGATGPNGLSAQATTSVSASRIVVTGNGECIAVTGAATVLNVLDSTLANCSSGINTAAGRTYAQRLRITDVVVGFEIAGSSNATANLDDSIVVMRSSAGFGAGISQFGSASGTLYLNQDTIIGVGSGNGARSGNHASTGAANVHVYDSIIRGFSDPLNVDSDSVSHPAFLDGDFVDYDGTPSVTPTHPFTADPLFVDAAHGDYHLQAGSPLIDQDPFPIDTAGGESATDLDGSVRIINGKRDLGAFERPLMPAAVTGDATGVTQTSATVPASANGGGALAGVKLVYGTTTAYGAEKPQAQTTAGFADQPYSIALADLAPGTTYHYALQVTNSVGTTTSADRTFTTGTPPPPPVCCAPPPVAKAALSALKISPSRFRAASKGATFAKAKTSAKVTYTLSAAGTVKFRVLRAAKGVKAGGRCVAKSRKHPRGKACTRYVAVGRSISRASNAGANSLRFSGRVGSKKLRPGRYRLQSLDPSGATKRASFRIVRR